MEKLQSSRPWREKINGSSMIASSDYTAPFSVLLDDYYEIFDSVSSASSIPVLDISMAENDFEIVGESAGVDYSDVFGSFGCGGLASYEELLAERKRSGGSSSEGRSRWDALTEQQEKEASEHPLKAYAENNEPNLEMNQYSSFPRQSDDVSSKQFSMSYHRMSRDTIENVISDEIQRGKLDAVPGFSVVDASDPVQDSKNKAVDKGTVDNTCTKGYTPDGVQKNEATPYFPSTVKKLVVNPPESDSASLLDVPGDEKQNSRSYSYHSTSRGYIPLHDVACLKVSEISLQTKPFKGPPPSRPPPKLSMKPEHPKVLHADSRFDVVEGSCLQSKVNNQLHIGNEATKIRTIDESMKGVSFLHDAEMDPSSVAAVSIAAIKEAMEQAQVRLASAKKLMDRKRDKSHWKVAPPKATSNKEDRTAYEVTLKNCSKVKDANNLLKESNTITECTFVETEEIRTGVKVPLNHEERKMQLPSYKKDQQQVSKENASKSFVERVEIRTAEKIPLNHEERRMQLLSNKKDRQQVRKENASKSSEVACKIVEITGEWKTDKEYFEILRNDRLLNTVKDIYIQGDEKKERAVIRSREDKEKYSKDAEQAIEVEEPKSMEVSVCIEKLEKYNKLKGPSMDCMEEANKNLADATIDEFLLKDHASELEEDYGSLLSDENQKQSEAHEDNCNENNVNKPDSVVDYCLYKENVNKLQNSNIDFKPVVANGYCEEKELKAAERVSGYVEYRREFIVSNVKCEVNKCSKKVTVQNETLFTDIFEKEIKEPDELCAFNTTSTKEVVEEINPCNNYENETRSMKHQYSYSACRCKIEESDNAAEKDEGDEFQTNEETHILVENELEQEAIQDENGLEMPEAQEKIKDAELEQILNSREGACCKDCNEKKTREARTALQEDKESMGALMNQEVKNSEFPASADGVCGKRVNENITEVPVLVENQISANSADEASQLGEIEESDTGKVFFSRKDGSLLATAQDATEISHVEKPGNHKHSLHTEVEENKSKMNVDRERIKEPQTSLEEKDLDRERERIVVERANYETRQQVLAEARVRAERIAVERVTAEARLRALAQARQKAEKDLDRERERERIVVERVNYEARQQVLAEARVRAERVAVEIATAEARLRALAQARQKAVKAAEAEKASREARLRAERAAVVRATEEARKRAIEKALAEKVAVDARACTAQVSGSTKDRLRKDNRTEPFKATHIKEDSEAKHQPTVAKIQRNAQSQTAACSSNDHIYSDSHDNGAVESKLRCKARQEREQQTAERATKALAERNMRDILVQREQAERDRLAASLDRELRKWSTGQEGNLRALLSTLHYILGPDGGWQPIPLTDIMNASSVKKAYRKATLCVHPDKLQQRGASIQQKYICEKVFDLLQEAWNKFNSEEP